MKRVVKILGYFILFLLFFLVAFYFWASASTLSQESYSEIIEFPNNKQVENDSVFKIMTYNVGYLSGMTNNQAVKREKKLYDDNLNALKERLNILRPDVIAFQEIDFDAARSFSVDQMEEVSNLGYRYAAKAVNWDERYVPFPYGWPSDHFGKVISGQSVQSKYEIKTQDRIVLQRVQDSPFYRDAFYLDRLAQVVKIEIQGETVVVINIHLEAYDQPTREAQAEEVLNIYSAYKDDFPTILLGDFNSDPNNENTIMTKFLSIQNIGNAAFDSNNYKSTYSSLEPINRIDYILYNTDYIEYLDGKVLSEFGDISDHLPVEMSFRLK